MFARQTAWRTSLTITAGTRSAGRLDAEPTPARDRRRRPVPEPHADLETAQPRSGVRAVRLVDGPAYELCHREPGAERLVTKKGVLTIRERHMCAPAHG